MERVQAVLDGTWTSTDTLGGVKEGWVKFAPMNNNIPFDVRNAASKAIIDIMTGATHPFTGPINKQDGTPWLAEGETATIDELMGMQFYVEGIDSQFPN